MKKEIILNNPGELMGKIVNEPMLLSDYPVGGYRITIESIESKVTPSQFKALHVWCGLQAAAMNDCGFEQMHWLELTKKGLEFPWSKDSVKENMFKPILKALTDKDSTTAMKTVDPDLILRPLHKKLSMLDTPVPCVDWPSNR